MSVRACVRAVLCCACVHVCVRVSCRKAGLIDEATSVGVRPLDDQADERLLKLQQEYVLLCEDYEIKIRESYHPSKYGDGDGSGRVVLER